MSALPSSFLLLPFSFSSAIWPVRARIGAIALSDAFVGSSLRKEMARWGCGWALIVVVVNVIVDCRILFEQNKHWNRVPGMHLLI